MPQKPAASTAQMLKITCFCLLAGKAYEHLFFEPYYSMFAQDIVPNLLPFFGILYLTAGILSLMATPKRRWMRPVLVLATLNLCLLTWSSYARTHYAGACASLYGTFHATQTKGILNTTGT